MGKSILPLIVLFLSSSLSLSSGCRGGDKSLHFRSLDQPQAWAVLRAEPAFLVVTEANWQTHYINLPQGADIKKNIYVVASWGTKPNPGYRISISRIGQSESTVTVKLSLQEPEPDKVYPQVIVRPTAVAELGKDAFKQRGALTFRFVDQKGNILAQISVQI